MVYVALVGNLMTTIAKFIAAALSGSSAMLSEGVHSLLDTINEVLHLYGLRRAQIPPESTRPLGHGRELYFWSFIVASPVLSLGSGVSAYQGIVHIRRPEPISHPLTNCCVLAVSVIFEGSSWYVVPCWCETNMPLASAR